VADTEAWADSYDPFDLRDFEPLTEQCAQSIDTLKYLEETEPLRIQHSADRSFYLILDEMAMAGDLPGPPQVLAVHVERDRAQGRARVEHHFTAMVPLAQLWLVEHGADLSAVAVRSGIYARPTGSATLRAEERLRTAGRYEVLAHFTYTWEPSESWVLALDRHQPDPHQPYRVFHREVGPCRPSAGGFALEPDPVRASYTVTEHGFGSLDAVQEWCGATDAAWTAQLPAWRFDPLSFDCDALPAHELPLVASHRAAAAAAIRAPSRGPRTAIPAPTPNGDLHHRPDRPTPRH
jgi:hypothetical protein